MLDFPSLGLPDDLFNSSPLPICVEELDDLEQHVKKQHQGCPLDIVLRSLCPSHCSLLYQILKLAQRENLLLPNLRSVGQILCQCFRKGAKPDNNTPHDVAVFEECKADKSKPCYQGTDCDSQNHSSTIYHLEDCKPNCSIHHYLLSNCKSKALQLTSCCNSHKPTIETCTALCPKRLHHNSCHCMAVDHTHKMMCACALLTKSTTLCIASSNLCTFSSTCCNKANLCSCPPLSNDASLALAQKTVERAVKDGDPPCPVLKREQSPSPPPLSPIPSDMDKKSNDKPPSLLHQGKGEGFEPLEKHERTLSDCNLKMVTVASREQECKSQAKFRAEPNASGTLLQDVVDRFSEKLDTIRPLEKKSPQDPTAFYVCDKESPKTPLTSRNKQFHADAHLTEIITTVLHTGKPSDYNLSELFNRHNGKEPKSPITRLQRRQEVLAARATPANEASARRHSLQIKRELAMFDQSYSRKRLLQSKRAKIMDENVTVTTLHTSETTMMKEKPNKNLSLVMELEPSQTKTINEGSLKNLVAKTDRNSVKEILAAALKKKVLKLKAEPTESEINIEEKSGAALDLETQTPHLQDASSNKESTGDHMQTHALTETADLPHSYEQPFDQGCGKCVTINEKDQLEYDKTSGKNQVLQETRRSRRNIVPPQRFSSFVTESRKMYFVACFSENIFSKKTQKEIAPVTLNAVSQDTALGDDNLKLNSVISTSENEERHHLESTLEKDGCHQFSSSPLKKQVVRQSIAKIESPADDSLDHEAGARDSNCHAKLLRRLRSTSNRMKDFKITSTGLENSSDMKMTKSIACVENEANHDVQYASPIKLMFVSPVKDKKGVRYSLKSAGSCSSGQSGEPFDPCVESSWAGTLNMKPKNTELATSKTKSGCSPSNFATSPSHSPPKPASCSPLPKMSSPSKSVASTLTYSSTTPSRSSPGDPVNTTPKSSPRRSSSSPTTALQSFSLSPRISPRRSGEGTAAKYTAGTEGQTSLCNLKPLHETTPPKRRPGRPKKLGPRLEQKVKRPIGRPRKQKNLDSVQDVNTVNKNYDPPSENPDSAKNLKITVVYGRSRRNKRTVSEGLGQLQPEIYDACQTVGPQSHLSVLRHIPKRISCSETASAELPEKLKAVSTVRESVSLGNSSIKCQKPENSVPLRKPGRPAKVKISGISVTVSTVSPRQRKIQMSKNTRQSPETSVRRKVLLPQLKSAKESVTIRCHLANATGIVDKAAETHVETFTGKLLNQPVAVRHSSRVRKPSINFLHAVATSTFRSYSHSNALLRRSKQFLLNKASNEKKTAAPESSVELKRQAFKQKRHNIPQDLSRVAGVSMDSIFPPEDTLHWWATSAKDKTVNHELARRIRQISETWISDTEEDEDNDMVLRARASTTGSKKSKHSSMVRTLFDCSPNKPRSCSMQQLCSWFMQTTETQSLAIVKKASSRNPYEVMHFPRSVNKKSICHSPQAERLRKHVKKFASTVPKTPLQHQQAKRNLRNMWLPTHRSRRQLFTSATTIGRHEGAGQRGHPAHGKYLAILLRARTKFLSYRERQKWHRRNRDFQSFKVSNGHLGTGLKFRHKGKAFCCSTRRRLSSRFGNYAGTSLVDQMRYSADVSKEQKLCSKAWSPQTLKECRVFLRKINSPDNVSCTNSCTVELEDRLPSTFLYSGHEKEPVEVVKTVKSARKMSRSQTSVRELAGAALKTLHDRDETQKAMQKRKIKSSGASTPEPSPPKMLRQSRMKGLTGPRWCDYVFEN